MLTSLLLSAGLPILTSFIQNVGGAVSRKFFGLSVDDEVKLSQAESAKLTSLAALDNPYGTPRQWVVDLRGSFRYIAATVLVVGGVVLAIYGAVTYDPEALQTGLEVASAPFGFIFGERLMLSLNGSLK